MTAASRDRETSTYGEHGGHRSCFTWPVAASTLIYGGTMVILNSSGYAVPTASGVVGEVIGVARKRADNSSGSNGAINVELDTGVFDFINGSSTAALANTNSGRFCFASDDQTLSLTNNAGLLPVAGKFIGLNPNNSLPMVEIGINSAYTRFVDELYIAAADLSSKQYYAVKISATAANVNVAGAGEMAIGVLQNAPASGEVAVVRRFGRTLIVMDSTGVTASVYVCPGTGGKGRAVTNAATGLGVCDTTGASATRPLIGANVLGLAVNTIAGDGTGLIDLMHTGLVPTTLL